MNLREAIEIAGKVSTSNSKMPGPSYAISARHCNVGGKLVDKEGSVCSKCYALRLQNFRSNVDKAWEVNYQKTLAVCSTDNWDVWDRYVEAMAYQIKAGVKRTGQPYMRWFDSGDLINTGHLSIIDRIAFETKGVTHYVPTKEASIVKDYGSVVNGNLIVRVSSPMIDQPPLTRFSTTTTVHTKGQPHEGFACPARDQGNKCGDCRACWDPTVTNVSYPKH